LKHHIKVHLSGTVLQGEKGARNIFGEVHIGEGLYTIPCQKFRLNNILVKGPCAGM